MTITVPKSRTRFRKAKERAFFYVVCGFSLLTAVPLLLIIWEVVRKGYRQISLSFFTENAPSTLDAMLAKTAGESIPGGIANGILGDADRGADRDPVGDSRRSLPVRKA